MKTGFFLFFSFLFDFWRENSSNPGNFCIKNFAKNQFYVKKITFYVKTVPILSQIWDFSKKDSDFFQKISQNSIVFFCFVFSYVFLGK